mmetsp:Transcript_7536/g.22323  ORF Transcript_7536/g.22323 Transcript_7536/m.22323 type:complete len:511 (+) Transcript_7536:906-2438(+)
MAAAAAAERAPFWRIARVWMRRMSLLPSASGSSTFSCTSSRPGRRRASSSSSGLFVRPTTRTFPASTTPSILERSWFTTESRTPDASPLAEPRFLAIASISSRMMTCNAEASPAASHSASAGAKSSRTLASASPTNLSRISGPLTTCGSRAPSDRASSRASSVLPQPGGPERRMPRTCEMPSRRAAAGSAREASTRRTIASSCASRPPTEPESASPSEPAPPAADTGGGGGGGGASRSTKMEREAGERGGGSDGSASSLSEWKGCRRITSSRADEPPAAAYSWTGPPICSSAPLVAAPSLRGEPTNSPDGRSLDTVAEPTSGRRRERTPSACRTRTALPSALPPLNRWSSRSQSSPPATRSVAAAHSPPASSHSRAHAPPSDVAAPTRSAAWRTAASSSLSHHVPHSGRPEPLDSPPSPVDSTTARVAAAHSASSTGGPAPEASAAFAGTESTFGELSEVNGVGAAAIGSPARGPSPAAWRRDGAVQAAANSGPAAARRKRGAAIGCEMH